MRLALLERRQVLAMGAGGVAGAMTRGQARAGESLAETVWGNVRHHDVAKGDERRADGHRIFLRDADARSATVEVDGQQVLLPLRRRGLPMNLAGLRIGVADTKASRALTLDKGFPQHRGLMGKDALLYTCDAGQPLLDPARFVFPIDRSEGFVWSMEENSHQFGFISPERSHEGIDIGMHEARGYDRHALLAVEDAVVRWVEKDKTQANEACVLLESQRQPGLYYVYQHLNRNALRTQAGAKVERGEPLGFIWGDGVWGHLHFAVLAPPAVPSFGTRYHNVVNAFAGLYELWHGDVQARPRRHARGTWVFDRHKAAHDNRKYLSAYDPLLGYGWRIEDFCGAMSVEAGPERGAAELDTSARLRHVLFAGTKAEARCPRGHYDFEVDVEEGRYEVQVRVGDLELATWQRVSVNGKPLGLHACAPGAFVWTSATTTPADGGKLIVRFHLRRETPAAASALYFRKIS